ncbi:MAG: DMT family transporter [Dehalococcoidales bacterium]|nr:DMT family transporter [Dehalococcoidales bacterium]
MTGLRGPLYLFGAFTLAGTSVIAAQLVSGQLGIFTIAAVSLLFSLLCLLPACSNRLIKAIRFMSAKGWIILFLQAASGIFLFRMFLLQGLLRTTAGEAGILTGAIPAVTAIMAWVLLKEPINKQGLIGIISTVCGVLLIQGILLPYNNFSMEHFLGNALVFCAAVCESAFNVFSRIASTKASFRQREPVSPVTQTAMVSLIAFILCLFPSFFEHPIALLSEIGLKEWLSLAWYGLVVTALAFVFWYAGIRRCRAFIAAAFSGMMPFVSLLLSITILGEYCGWRQWSGCILVILGMILIAGRSAPVKKNRYHSIIRTKNIRRRKGVYF